MFVKHSSLYRQYPILNALTSVEMLPASITLAYWSIVVLLCKIRLDFKMFGQHKHTSLYRQVPTLND
jgi:hypothetical protein